MEKIQLSLQQFLTIVGPAQTVEIIEEDAKEPAFTGKAVKVRDREELLLREVKHIQPVQGPQPRPILKVWIY